MRIAHVIESLDPATGGPMAVATRLAAAQAALGHEVTIITRPESEKRAQIDKATGSIPGFERVKLLSVAQPSLAHALLLKRGVVEIEPLVRGQSWLHLHGVWEPILLNASRAARKLGVPYALVPHGMLDVWSLQQRRWKKKLALAAGFSSMIDGARYLHVLNVDEQAAIERLGLKPALRTIPNGVFINELRPLPERGAFHSAHPELRGRRYVLFMSRLHYKKGLDYLADAFAKVCAQRDDVDLVVAGPDGGERAPFESLVAKHNIAPRVHVVGPIYGPAKLAALVGAEVFCLPSRQEGFSMAITESLGCGTPVVISDQCHFPEVASVGAGHVTPLDAHRVGDALLDVLSDAARARSMGEKGRAMIERDYTWPRIAQLTLDCYQELAPPSR
jgi:glycosyltransferase involved in cell wall biosynthesis